MHPQMGIKIPGRAFNYKAAGGGRAGHRRPPRALRNKCPDPAVRGAALTLQKYTPSPTGCPWEHKTRCTRRAGHPHVGHLVPPTVRGDTPEERGT